STSTSTGSVGFERSVDGYGHNLAYFNIGGPIVKKVVDKEKDLKKSILGDIDSKTQIIGRVEIGAKSKIINCTIRGPVIIGNNCYLENCFIGPYSSIADNSTLIETDLEHSVVLEGAKITGIQQRIIDSLIGQRAQLSIAPRRPKALRFLIGDDSQIELT
ncbi:MAG: hypothetical protein ACKN9K_16385, partial [Dolichospermum sp.]